MRLDGIIVKYCTGVLINRERVVNPDWSQLKLGTGLQLVIWKELERWAEHFENVLDRGRAAGEDIKENERFLRYLGWICFVRKN